MTTFMAEQTPSMIGPNEVRQALESILRSKHFVNAHKKKKFLRLICDFYLEGRAHELNEHILGYDVFGRDNSYHPSDDPIVRVFAYEIRKKLEAYYANEGANDPIHLDIPAGSYQPVFTRYAPEPSREDSETTLPALPGLEVKAVKRRFTPTVIVMGLTILGLTIVVIALAMSNRHLQNEMVKNDVARNPLTYGRIWSSFLKGNNPTLVILSNPPTLRFINPSDPEGLMKDSIPLAPETAEALKDKFVLNPEVSMKAADETTDDKNKDSKDEIVIERNKPPRLILSTIGYTGIGEAIGLHYLTDFFRRANRNILLKQSRTLSAEDLKKHNVILLGGAWANEWAGKLTKNEDFVFTNRGTVENRNPQPGEEREYVPQFDRRTGNLRVDYALITIKPNISEGNEVMLLAGIYSEGTEAAAEYVTNQNYLEQLNQRLQPLLNSGAPRYFQALLMARVENGIPTTISILALHPLRLP